MSKPYSRLFKAEHDRVIGAGGVNALAVYVALCRIQSDAPPDQKSLFKAGAARIARHSAVSTRSVKRALPILAAEGLIQITSGRRKDRLSDHEENQITLLGNAAHTSKGSDRESLGSDTESVRDGTRIKASKEAIKEKSRFAGSEAKASPASGREEKKSQQRPTDSGWNLRSI